MNKAEKKKQKQDRLVQALRDNLKRRKQHPAGDPSPKPEAGAEKPARPVKDD